MMPEIESVSSVTAVTWAIDLWASAMTFRRLWPTHRVSRKKNGSTAIATKVNCQEMNSMATMVVSKTTMLETESARVLVTTDRMPPMSLDTRDCISPVRVRARKFSDIPCR